MYILDVPVHELRLLSAGLYGTYYDVKKPHQSIRVLPYLLGGLNVFCLSPGVVKFNGWRSVLEILLVRDNFYFVGCELTT